MVCAEEVHHHLIQNLLALLYLEGQMSYVSRLHLLELAFVAVGASGRHQTELGDNYKVHS